MNYKNIRGSFLLTLSVIFLIASEVLLSKTVIIDPGHGGKDKGAYWYGINVLMTRKSDQYVSIQDRASIANKHSNAIFVSIHFNAHTNSSVKGIETFYLSSKGKKLASSIQSRLARRINTRNRGSKKYHYAVLRKTRGVAALVECGFISNRWEGNRCASNWYKEILAQEITDGITAYCNNN